MLGRSYVDPAGAHVGDGAGNAAEGAAGHAHERDDQGDARDGGERHQRRPDASAAQSANAPDPHGERRTAGCRVRRATAGQGAAGSSPTTRPSASSTTRWARPAHRRVVGNDDDGVPARGDAPEQLEHFVRLRGIEGAGGLVGQHDPRIVHQRPGDADALPLAARQFVRVAAPPCRRGRPAPTAPGRAGGGLRRRRRDKWPAAPRCAPPWRHRTGSPGTRTRCLPGEAAPDRRGSTRRHPRRQTGRFPPTPGPGSRARAAAWTSRPRTGRECRPVRRRRCGAKRRGAPGPRRRPRHARSRRRRHRSVASRRCVQYAALLPTHMPACRRFAARPTHPGCSKTLYSRIVAQPWQQPPHR